MVKTDGVSITQQPNSEPLPLMETVMIEVDSPRNEVRAIRVKNWRLHIELGNFASEKELLKQELAEVWSQLEIERADHKQIEA